MNYFTTDVSHLKRDIVKFCYILTKRCKVVDSNLILDLVYGILASQDIKLSSITRELYEKIEDHKTIRRLSKRLKEIESKDIVKYNFREYVKRFIPIENVVAIFDDSDIVKVYGKKFEDLDLVVDGSDPNKKPKHGYHVCNACILTKNQKQPLEVFSKIYSTKSKGFKSTKAITIESINEVTKIAGNSFTGIFDRGYDDKKIFRLLNNQGTKFVIRLTSNRNMLFKGKNKNVLDVANGRKGKYKMILKRSGKKDQEIYVSYTRANLPDGDKEEFTIVFAYGLGDEPLMLITNIDVKDGNDAIKIVRWYIDRWKIEEVHRAEKTMYNYEDMRVRSLEQINNLNFIFMLTLFFICIQIEKIDTKLLSIEIIIRSKSLKENLTVWISPFSRGIVEILKHSQTGIKNFKKRTRKNKEEIDMENETQIIYEQLSIFDDLKNVKS